MLSRFRKVVIVIQESGISKNLRIEKSIYILSDLTLVTGRYCGWVQIVAGPSDFTVGFAE